MNSSASDFTIAFFATEDGREHETHRYPISTQIFLAYRSSPSAALTAVDVAHSVGVGYRIFDPSGRERLIFRSKPEG